MCRRQAEQLPTPQRRERPPRRQRGSGWRTLAITALPIFALASVVLFVVV